jgi:hypothetical protein
MPDMHHTIGGGICERNPMKFMEEPFDLIQGFVVGFLEGRRIEGAIIFERGHHVKRLDRA